MEAALSAQGVSIQLFGDHTDIFQSPGDFVLVRSLWKIVFVFVSCDPEN